MKRAVCLLSGGLDSATALACARRDGFETFALTFDYGQRHRIELEAAALVARHLGAAGHRVFRIDLRAFGGSALTADIAVPKDRPLETASADIPVTYVPARNTVFLSIALAWAEVLGSSDIYIGVNAVDYSGYPDCRDDTLKAMQVALNLGMASRFVLHTPLMWRDKAATWALAERLGGAALVEAIAEDTHSCYLGDRGRRHPWGHGCGTCPACALRRRGWEAWQGGASE